ncbi:MAG: hypothetical protein ACRD0G_16335 [Acidimicrobiales bacterium]
MGRLRAPSIGFVVGLLVAVAGLAAGLDQLSDNSFLTHLATGRLLLDGDIPRHDVYTFTADGDPWVVQSWLASLLFGAADEVAGGDGVRIVFGVTMAGLAGAGWTLTRPASELIGRLVALVPFLVVGLGGGWQERPFVIGLLLLAVALLAAEGGFSPRWLVPVGWVWLNVHGSWPLGLVALGLLAVGRRLDGKRPEHELAALRWLAAGLALGALNPYGPRLWVFPFELLGRRDTLRTIVEWRAPQFQSTAELAFLAGVALAVIVLCRRPTWRAALPLAVFTAAALLGARNVPVAAVVLLPGTAAALSGLGTVRSELHRPVLRMAVVAVAVLGLAVAAARLERPAFDLEGYPVAATGWLEDNGLDPRTTRIAAQDVVGNFWELRYGADASVFADDRVEVLPAQLFEDEVTLLNGDRGWDDILDSYRIEAVLWPAEEALSELLALHPGWQRVHEDDGYVVFRRD